MNLDGCCWIVQQKGCPSDMRKTEVFALGSRFVVGIHLLVCLVLEILFNGTYSPSNLRRRVWCFFAEVIWKTFQRQHLIISADGIICESGPGAAWGQDHKKLSPAGHFWFLRKSGNAILKTSEGLPGWGEDMGSVSCLLKGLKNEPEEMAVWGGL